MSAATETWKNKKRISTSHEDCELFPYHLEALVRKLPGLVARGAVYPTTLPMVLCRLEDPRNSFFQLLVHHAVHDGMADVVSKIERADEEDIDARHFGDRIHLFRTPLAVYFDSGRTGQPTFCKPSFVSICTIVNKLSFACCKYSCVVCPLNFSIGNGEPKPRWPTGGNLADLTSLIASSAVYRRGTMMPCAPESSAPASTRWLS